MKNCIPTIPNRIEIFIEIPTKQIYSMVIEFFFVLMSM